MSHFENLTLVVDDIPLVTPSFKITLHLDLTFDWAELVMFYECVCEMLKPLASFHSSDSSGGKILKAQPATLEKKLNELKMLKPGKRFYHEFSALKSGQGSAGALFLVQCRHVEHPLDKYREEWNTALEEMERTGESRLPLGGPVIQVFVPINHPMTKADEFHRWSVSQPIFRSKQLLSATVGYAVMACRGETVQMPQMHRFYDQLVAKLTEISEMYPFVEQQYVRGALTCIDFATYRRHNRFLPMIGSIGWRSFISPLMLEHVGGLGPEILQNPGIKITNQESGVWIQLGGTADTQLEVKSDRGIAQMFYDVARRIQSVCTTRYSIPV